jgi:hypothetical protein
MFVPVDDILEEMSCPEFISISQIICTDIAQYCNLKCNYINTGWYLRYAVVIDQFNIGIDNFVIEPLSRIQ